MNYAVAFAAGVSFDDYVAGTQQYTDLWRAIYGRAAVHEADIVAVEATGRSWKLLVISEDWCGDAVNTVPVVARLAEKAANVEMRVIARDQHLDVMDDHLSATGGRSIPVVILLDEAFDEVGWWGARPVELQAWYEAGGAAVEKTARYRHVRGWYARDKGASVISELRAIMRNAADAAGAAAHDAVSRDLH